jgi:hypothetical protein
VSLPGIPGLFSFPTRHEQPWLLAASSWNRGLVMETDTTRAIVKAIYPTIIMVTVMLLAASLL